jgi:hypothetical protein
MKAILLALSLAQPLSPPPPELSQLKWLIGNWSCRIQFHDPERSIHGARKSEREFTFRAERDGRITEEATCTRL